MGGETSTPSVTPLLVAIARNVDLPPTTSAVPSLTTSSYTQSQIPATYNTNAAVNHPVTLSSVRGRVTALGQRKPGSTSVRVRAAISIPFMHIVHSLGFAKINGHTIKAGACSKSCPLANVPGTSGFVRSNKVPSKDEALTPKKLGLHTDFVPSTRAIPRKRTRLKLSTFRVGPKSGHERARRELK